MPNNNISPDTLAIIQAINSMEKSINSNLHDLKAEVVNQGNLTRQTVTNEARQTRDTLRTETSVARIHMLSSLITIATCIGSVFVYFSDVRPTLAEYKAAITNTVDK